MRGVGVLLVRWIVGAAAGSSPDTPRTPRVAWLHDADRERAQLAGPEAANASKSPGACFRWLDAEFRSTGSPCCCVHRGVSRQPRGGIQPSGQSTRMTIIPCGSSFHWSFRRALNAIIDEPVSICGVASLELAISLEYVDAALTDFLVVRRQTSPHRGRALNSTRARGVTQS
jgi:hypothetical protein